MSNAAKANQNLSKVVDDLRREVAKLRKFQDRSIDGFCARQSFTRQHFYNLKKKRKAPRVAYVGARVIITPEAEREWEREREAETDREAANAAEARG
jgi:hypothetical protein